MKTYTYGCTPESVIMNSLPNSYNMELVSSDYKVFAKLVNVGIDSRLQAVILSQKNISICDNKAGLSLNKESMLCLLNRCFDYGLSDYDLLDESEKEIALNLRSSILYTLGIEEL